MAKVSKFSKDLAGSLMSPKNPRGMMHHPSGKTMVPHHRMSQDSKMLHAYPTTVKTAMNKQRGVPRHKSPSK